MNAGAAWAPTAVGGGHRGGGRCERRCDAARLYGRPCPRTCASTGRRVHQGPVHYEHPPIQAKHNRTQRPGRRPGGRACLLGKPTTANRNSANMNCQEPRTRFTHGLSFARIVRGAQPPHLKPTNHRQGGMYCASLRSVDLQWALFAHGGVGEHKLLRRPDLGGCLP